MIVQWEKEVCKQKAETWKAYLGVGQCGGG